MTQHVLTYATVEQLYEEQSLFRNYTDVLHITATSTLRRGLTAYMAEEERLITAPILTFAQILSAVGCDIESREGRDSWPWYSSKTQLKQYTRISETLRHLTLAEQDMNGKVYNAMTKNKDVLLRTLRMFTEAGETSTAVRRKLGQAMSYEERLALTVWEALEQDETFDAFNKWKQNLQTTGSGNIENMFTKIFSDILANDEERQSANLLPEYGGLSEKELLKRANELARTYVGRKKIVLHGFYFITPIQQQIIDALQCAGFDIIHLINYQHGYRTVFEVVDVFLEKQKYEFKMVSDTTPYFNKVAQKFLHICEGDFRLDLKDMPDKYFEFNHMYQFKEYIENEMRTEKEVHDLIISPRAREVRSQVEDMGAMKLLTLKDYPIGQFLVDLHALNVTTFDEHTKRFNDREELSVDLLMRIFSLGYIKINNISTRFLVRDLSKLRERLTGKYSFNEWRREVQHIIEEKQLIEEALTPDSVEVTNDNEIYIYRNRLLSYYDVTVENLTCILEALKAVERLYEEIFSTDSSVQVKNYVERLVQHLHSEIIPNIEHEEEIVVAEELLQNLEEMGKSDFDNFDRQDLIQGLRFFLSGELDNNDNSLFGESLIDSKIVSLQDGDILPFLENQAVHLAFLDNKALPLSQNLVTWPFNDDSMDILYKKSQASQTKGLYLHYFQRRKRYDAAITKYLLYLIMVNASAIKFSIVSNLGAEQGLKKSFYLDLLELTKASEEAKNNKDNFNAVHIGYRPGDIEVGKRKGTKLIESTKKICQKRMVLSYMLQTAPSFETEYHQRFLFENFIAQLHGFVKAGKVQVTQDEIRGIVADWFPHWSETKRLILAVKAEKWEYRPYPTTVDNVKFDDDLTRMSLFGRLDRNEEKFVNAGAHCKYCPFQDRCRESEFAKDE